MPEQYEGADMQTLAEKVEASVAAVWARFVGERPVVSRTEQDGNVFRMTMPNGAEQFAQGIAFHEYGDVPPYPASHGCVRVPQPEARYLYRFAAIGRRVVVF